MNQKMITSISVVSLCLLFSCSCYGSSTKEKHEMLNTYTKLTSIDTKYDKHEVNSEGSADFTSEGLKQSIRENVKSFKCFFKFIALSYLRITKLLLTVNAEDQLDDTIDRIESLADYALTMITAIGNLNVRSEYSLWLFYMYVSQIRVYCDFYKSRETQNLPAQVVLKLNYMNENVRRLVKEKLTRCEENSFDISSYKSEFRETYKALGKNGGSYDGALKLLESYNKQVENVMQLNKTKCDLFTRNKQHYTYDRFYLNDLALNNSELNNFFELYDSNIEWGRTRDSLQQAYHEAPNSPENLYDGMGKLKKYHKLTQNMLTTIMLRITWTHLELVQMSLPNNKSIFTAMVGNIVTKHKVSQKNSTMANILTKFTNVVGLDESLLSNIIQCLSQKSWSCVTNNHMGIEIIKKLLKQISDDFPGLDATSKTVYENECKFINNTIKLNSFSKKMDISSQCDLNTSGKDSVLKNNFLRAAVLIGHIEKVFHSIDFNFIRSIFGSAHVITREEVNFDDLDQTSHLLEKNSSLRSMGISDSAYGGFDIQSAEYNSDSSRSSVCDSDNDDSPEERTKPTVTTRDLSNKNSKPKVSTKDSVEHYDTQKIASKKFSKQNNYVRVTASEFLKQYNNSKANSEELWDDYNVPEVTAEDCRRQNKKSNISREIRPSAPLNLPLYKIKNKQD